MAVKQNLFGLEQGEMEEFFSSIGEKPFRARQVAKRIYKGNVLDFAKMTELSGPLREKLAKEATLDLPKIVDRQESVDGTVKLLLEFEDGERVESVLIPDGERLTQCISTQVGCAMGCTFCRTASEGLTRSLDAAEIVSQVILAQNEGGFDKKVTNLVFMGMGEPLHNFEGTVKAVRILRSEYGLDIARRKITISTCGLVDKIKELPEDMLLNLAISLNATTDEVRSELMPVNKKYPIRELLETLEGVSLTARGRFTIEYVLLGGVNDSLEDAKRLAKLLSPHRYKINLIPYNPHDESPFKAPTREAVKSFQTYMLDNKFTAVLRKSRGEDILAACGQLRAKDIGAKAKKAQE